jgi:aspartate aminotransferase
LAGATPVIINTYPEENFIVKPEMLLEAITPKTKGIIINSPANPTGILYTEAELLALTPILEKHKLWIISDDIYETLIYDNLKFFNIPMVAPELKDQTIICHGVSKTFSMTGWRIGFLAAPREVAKAIAKIQSQMTSNPCSIAQKAGLAALTGPQDSFVKMHNIFSQRRQLILKLLQEIPSFTTPIPQGAFYVFPNISKLLGSTVKGKKILSSDDLSSLLLEECEVATVPGSGFGFDGAIRFSYAASEKEILDGIEKISRFLSPVELPPDSTDWIKKALPTRPKSAPNER